MRAEAPAYRLKWVFGQMVWLVPRYDDALMVLRHERFANNWIATTLAFGQGSHFCWEHRSRGWRARSP